MLRLRAAAISLPPVVIAVGLLPPTVAAWILWLAPLSGLPADRAALAARDFTALWGAGRAAAETMLGVLPDPAAFTAYLRTMFGPGMPNQIWPYPPPILLLATPLAALPLGASFLLYLLGGLIAFASVLRLGRCPASAIAAILLSPAVADNALAGQNGALIAATLAGLLLIDRRPLLAGLLLGGLSIKPQFLLLLPVCLAASARWRTLSAACASSGSLALLSILIFGYKPWVEFLLNNHKVVAAYIGAPWQSDPAQSIFVSAFMAARSLGASVSAAAISQAAVSCACAYAAWLLWREPRTPPKQRTAATIPLVLLASPWTHTYDMPALALAVWLCFPCSLGVQRILLVFAWLWPGMSLLLPVPPAITIVSVASVALIALSAARRGWAAPRPALLSSSA